jgi:lipopolysaccharide/colanic/teichoic acid biosynthesis glycosyltransferase
MALSLVSFRQSRFGNNGAKRPSESEMEWEEFHPLAEQVFLPMLAQERKRSERSGKPFILLLLKGNDLFLGDKGNEVISRISSVIRTATRETDVLGWYQSGEVLGVIFTEVGELTDGSVEIILTRVTTALSDHLDREELDRVSITCHVYPEQAVSSGDSKNLKLFYPESKSKKPGRRFERFLKRSVDIVGSLFAILMLAPVFAVVALIVRLTSEGPILFRQKRVGRFGESFTFLKFRSMYMNNDASAHQEYVKNLISGKAEKQDTPGNVKVFKITNDPRITPIGRFIRKTSLDELPQFFNVLRGDMSLVGPRPPVPYEYECYDIWHRKRVFEVKPGITGLWQVTGRSRTTFDEMVRLDLKYVRNWSFWLDIKILLRTPWVMVSGDGGY